ncbi:MAG TPA: hypothetical protein VM580_04075, partial [Labilithrix sp.]|nr:hypothetical protein [Labilithrix sp.]
MATDNTPPRLKLIVTIGVITVITLIGIDFATKSYFAMMSDQAQREKLAPTRDRDERAKAEATALTNGAMPINQAMAQLAKGTRPELIAPQQSEDVGAMTGWTKLPKPAPVPHPRIEVQVESDAGATSSDDAGATPLAGDAGATSPADDAGAMHAAPPADAGATVTGDAGATPLAGDAGA